MPLLTPAHPDWKKLFEPSEPVTDYATQVLPYLREMREIIERRKAIGGYAISACQIGVFRRFFIFGGKHLKSSVVHVVVNPTQVKQSGVLSLQDEGCLSFPSLRTPVERYAKVTFTYQNRENNLAYFISDSLLLNRVMQHELDHLDGITIFSPSEI